MLTPTLIRTNYEEMQNHVASQPNLVYRYAFDAGSPINGANICLRTVSTNETIAEWVAPTFHSDRANWRAYQQMLRIAGTIGWPVDYQNDLYVYSRNWLATNPDQRFIWHVRASGSDIFPFSEHLSLTSLAYYVNYGGTLGSDRKFFHWDHNFGSLVEVTAEQAHALILEYVMLSVNTPINAPVNAPSRTRDPRITL